MKYLQLCQIYQQLEENPGRLKKTEILAGFLEKVKREKDKGVIYLIQGNLFPDWDERESGISTQLVIKALERATGISNGEIVNLWKKHGDLGLVAEEVVGKKKQSTLGSTNLSIDKILDNLRKLPELVGKGTVDRKLALISELLTSAKPIEAKYLIRTLIGDLRIGLGSGTIRDAIVWGCFGKGEQVKDKEIYEVVQDAYDLSTDFALVFVKACKGLKALQDVELAIGKPVKVMLYQKETSIEGGFKRVGKPCLIDYKYDGFRMLINKDDKGEINIFTRRLDNVKKQFPEVVEYAEKYVKAKSFMLDAEAVGFNPKTKKYRPFQEISQRIKRKYDISDMARELPVEINVFDIIYHNGKSLIKTELKERRKIIEKIVKKQKLKIKPASAIITGDLEKAEKFYNKALADGEEGIMMKNLASPYKPGSRVGHGIKIKPEDNDFDLVIVGAEWGTGKRAGWLTSYTVSCRDDDSGELLEIGKVGSGLKEKEEQGLSFMELTKKLKPLVVKESGREVKVKPKVVVAVTYQNLQKSPTYKSGYAMRFPRITRLRPDRSKSDIAKLSEIEKQYKEKER